MNDRWLREKSDYLAMMSDPSYLNATRKQTPQRDYVNLPSTSTANDGYLQMNSPRPHSSSEPDPVPHYQNVSTNIEKQEPVTDSSGYLCMRSPTKSKCNNIGDKFVFDVEERSPQLRPAETVGADRTEIEPMINKQTNVPNSTTPHPLTLKTNFDDFRRSRLDSGISSPSCFYNPSYQSLMMLDKQHDFLNVPNNIIEENEKRNHLSFESDNSSGFQSDGSDNLKNTKLPQFVDAPPPPYVIATTIDPQLI